MTANLVVILASWGCINVICAAMNVRNARRNVKNAESNEGQARAALDDVTIKVDVESIREMLRARAARKRDNS